MLRQHDILLKRQFFNIQDSIQSLQKSKSSTTASFKPTDNLNSNNNNNDNANTTSTSASLHNGDVLLEEAKPEVNGRLEEAADKTSSSSSNGSSNDFPLETFVVRPSSSVTMLHEDSDEEEDADLFAEEFFFRPRTSSMRTSRDMAALARRRGSKELI